jgi:3-hydroxyisobutyrate dehydrogenase-like beta-hydroxyacid dehydrogenase
MTDGPRIGFIGVGLMGHGMAKNILERGYAVTVLGHRNRVPVEDLVKRGAKEADDPAAVAAASDVVILCLPSSAEVEATFQGDRGLLAGVREGMVFIDTTTADPATTRQIGATLVARGCHLVDAALGRSAKEAEEGCLSTYVGGDPGIIETIQPILAAFADTIVVCGPLGTGTSCKLINNSIAIGMATLIAEGLVTAAKVGLDLDALARVLSAGGVNGRMWQVMEPWLREGDDSGLQGTMWTVAKDMRTYGRMAESAGAPVSVAEAVGQTMQRAVDHGYADRFLPTLPGILAKLGGTKIRQIE